MAVALINECSDRHRALMQAWRYSATTNPRLVLFLSFKIRFLPDPYKAARCQYDDAPHCSLMPPPYGQPPYGGDAQYSRAQLAPGAFPFLSASSPPIPAPSQHNLPRPQQTHLNPLAYGHPGPAFEGGGSPFEGPHLASGHDLYRQDRQGAEGVLAPPPRGQRFAGGNTLYGPPGLPRLPDIFGAASPKALHPDVWPEGHAPVMPRRPGPMRDVQVLPPGLGRPQEHLQCAATGQADVYRGSGKFHSANCQAQLMIVHPAENLAYGPMGQALAGNPQVLPPMPGAPAPNNPSHTQARPPPDSASHPHASPLTATVAKDPAAQQPQKTPRAKGKPRSKAASKAKPPSTPKTKQSAKRIGGVGSKSGQANRRECGISDDEIAELSAAQRSAASIKRKQVEEDNEDEDEPADEEGDDDAEEEEEQDDEEMSGGKRGLTDLQKRMIIEYITTPDVYKTRRVAMNNIATHVSECVDRSSLSLTTVPSLSTLFSRVRSLIRKNRPGPYDF